MQSMHLTLCCMNYSLCQASPLTDVRWGKMDSAPLCTLPSEAATGNTYSRWESASELLVSLRVRTLVRLMYTFICRLNSSIKTLFYSWLTSHTLLFSLCSCCFLLLESVINFLSVCHDVTFMECCRCWVTAMTQHLYLKLILVLYCTNSSTTYWWPR